MESPSRKILKFFSPKRILLPILIGVGCVAYMLLNTLDFGEIRLEKWTSSVVFWLVISLIMVAIRDIAYMYRIRLLTDQLISWRNSFDVIMLWEFASAITPSVVGGAGIAIFILNKEKIALGKSTAIVMTTALFDELFYVVMVPLIFLLSGVGAIFPPDSSRAVFGVVLSTKYAFAIGYSFILLLTVTLFYATYFNPYGFSRALDAIFRVSWLARWRERAHQIGEDIITTSVELKGKSFVFWFKAFAATVFAWTARFWVVNCIILAFSALDLVQHFGVYARQLVMWVILLISPTPGGVGVAEILFPEFLDDYITQNSPVMLGIIWRLFSYWPYLIIGVIVLPKWIQRVFLKRRLIQFKNTKY